MLRAQPDAVTAVLLVTAWDELEVKVRLKEKKRRQKKKAREPKQVLEDLLHDMLHLPLRLRILPMHPVLVGDWLGSSILPAIGSRADDVVNHNLSASTDPWSFAKRDTPNRLAF
jgi:hypothetical protein